MCRIKHFHQIRCYTTASALHWKKNTFYLFFSLLRIQWSFMVLQKQQHASKFFGSQTQTHIFLLRMTLFVYLFPRTQFLSLHGRARSSLAVITPTSESTGGVLGGDYFQQLTDTRCALPAVCVSSSRTGQCVFIVLLRWCVFTGALWLRGIKTDRTMYSL